MRVLSACITLLALTAPTPTLALEVQSLRGRSARATSAHTDRGVLTREADPQTSQEAALVSNVKPSVASAELPAFYIYPESVFNTTELLAGCKEDYSWASYLNIHPYILRQLGAHSNRVLRPEEATYFIVPFNLDLNDVVGDCNGTRAADRVAAALDELDASYYFRRNQGSDHIWVAMRWRIYPGWPLQNASFFPPERRFMLRNMVIGQYMSYHLTFSDRVYGFEAEGLNDSSWWREAYDWRCTLVLPVLSAPGLMMPAQHFEAWLERPNQLFFRGANPKHCMHGGEELRNKALALKGVVPKSIIEPGHADSVQRYQQEISSSKFCLVMRCDDPQTSRFVDALAAACIPVVVSDGWGLTSKPFASHINYDAFTVVIPESLWNQDAFGAAHFAYNWPHSKLESMYTALLAARKYLLWSHPESQTAALAMKEVAQECPV